MKLASSVLDIDLPKIESRIKRFVNEYVEKVGADGVVLGLSGGIDSATVAALSSLSIGGDRVLGILIPEKETLNERDMNDAKNVAKQFDIEMHICDITKALEAFYATIPIFEPNDKICKGNVKARIRMTVLYYYANKLNRIVCGSSDKSETMIGYFTKWGDVAADIYPIMDLYKTQVRKLAQYIGISQELVSKPSTPALWPNQFAETELGIKYDKLDLILYGLERFMSSEEISCQLGIEKKLVSQIKKRWVSTEHKRQPLLAPKLQYRTVGADFRLPRSV